MTNHSRLSPSSRHRWQLCPGSVREEAKYPDDTSSKASIDGTHSHTLLEACLLTGSQAIEWVGKQSSDHDGKFVVDAARAERVQIALDYIRGADWSRVVTEKRVHPNKTTGRNDLSGTVDVQIHHNPYLVEVIDYKNGMSPVSAINNPQLEQYALGVIDDNNLPQDCVIRMTIIQPKLRIKGLPAISSHDMTVKELRTTVARAIILEAAATDRPDAPLVAGDVQCKHCKAKGGCSVLANKTMESVGMMFQAVNFESIGVPDEVYAVAAKQLSDLIDQQVMNTVAQQSADKDPTTMTNEQLVEILEAAPLMRQMLDAAEEEALNRAKAGQTVPGYKVVHGPGSRAWVHDPEEMAAKLVKMGIPKSAIYVTKLVSPPQAEKLVWEKKGVKTTLSDKQLKRMETEYVKKSPGRLTLVPESDPRESVVEHVVGLFPAVNVTTEAPDQVTFFHAPLPDWLK